MKIYKENIKRCKSFYKSDFYNQLLKCNSEFIEVIFTELCLDADACDIELYQELAEKFGLVPKKYYLIDYVGKEEILLSADVICGRKQLAKIRNYNFDFWIKDYENIRSNIDYHFIWPKHKLPTINTYRYQIYKDRIDCLLYDLKQFYRGEETPMLKAYQNDKTAIWLKKFLSFEDFIVKMKFNKFVNENFEVLDLSKNDGSIIRKYIRGNELIDSIPAYIETILGDYIKR